MQIITPQYYKAFKCTAEKCKNSCCIGWEIDIDDETLDIYENIPGELGARLKNGISYEGDAPHFITDKTGRCPFLNKSGLCDIITALGEDGLCQICYDHPRFRNFFTDRVEMGIGLCCEAAAELVLSSRDKMALTVLESDNQAEISSEKESHLFSERQKLFNIFQDSATPLKSRIEQVARLYDLSPFFTEAKSLIKKYRSLERLDPRWDLFLTSAENKNYSAEFVLSAAEEKIPLPTEQLLCYFTYRYFASAEKPHLAVGFILESTLLCLLICISYYGKLNLENFADLCRRFSLEVEYSEENINTLLSKRD